MQAHKTLRSRGKSLRKEILLNKLCKAETAAKSNLPGELYKATREIAPSRRHEKVQIRSADGKILNEVEEMAEITAHCEQVFGVGDFGPPTLILFASRRKSFKMSYRNHKMVSLFHVTACQSQFGRPVQECYRRGCAPLPIHTGVRDCCGIPPTWADSHLALIPKPGKLIKRPKDLRPLGTQDPGGKCMARVLTDRLLQEIGDYLRTVPQYEFFPNESIDQAMPRVASHCFKIRARLKEGAETVHTRRLKLNKGQGTWSL